MKPHPQPFYLLVKYILVNYNGKMQQKRVIQMK